MSIIMSRRTFTKEAHVLNPLHRNVITSYITALRRVGIRYLAAHRSLYRLDIYL